jgi:carbon monoxide dehydrogenase subunit G
VQLSGKTTIRAPRALCIAALHRAETLAAFLPGDVTVTPRDATSFDVEFKREFGRIAVKLRGTLTVEEVEAGRLFRFVMLAKHMLAGSANLDIAMTFTGNAPTELAYDGTLTGSGLAGRMIAEREDRVQPKLDEMFAGLAQRIEAERRAARA